MHYMKPFVKKLLALAIAAAITLSVIPAVHAADAQISEQWTSPETSSVEEMVPARILTVSMDAPMTRRDLCGMTMSVYTSMTVQSRASLGEAENIFIDTCDQDIVNAYALELVTADDSGFFYPAESVSRQDFYTSAVKLLDTLGYAYTNDIEMDLSCYSDADELMDYAVQPTEVMLYIGAIEETGSLEPNQPITSGEAILIMDQLISFFTEWQENPVEPHRYLGEDIVDLALTKIGCRYVRGCHGPKKFDCSGLVYWVYKQYGYDLKPGARNQWSMLGKTIKKADLLPGDLLFYSKNGKASGIFHVGIYIGDGQFVHAANSRKGVIVTDIDDSWYASRYVGAKRAIN